MPPLLEHLEHADPVQRAAFRMESTAVFELGWNVDVRSTMLPSEISSQKLMPVILPKTMTINEPERTRRSLIKPHLRNLSGSGSRLDGIIIERDVEQPNWDIDRTSVKSPKHVIVLHSGNPAALEWRIDGEWKKAIFSEGDAIVNPAGLFVAPRWSAEVELLLLAINPDLFSGSRKKWVIAATWN